MGRTKQREMGGGGPSARRPAQPVSALRTPQPDESRLDESVTGGTPESPPRATFGSGYMMGSGLGGGYMIGSGLGGGFMLGSGN
jgi:hypothetical protein